MQNDHFRKKFPLDPDCLVGGGVKMRYGQGGFKAPQPLSLAAVQWRSQPLPETAVVTALYRCR